MIRKGTGRAKSQPTTRIGLRPMRSDARAASRLMIAFVTPKLTMNDVMAVFELSPNSCSPRSGSTVRSRRRRSGRRGARTGGSSPAVRAASRSCSAEIAPPVLGESLRLRREVRQDELDEFRLRGEAERRIEAALEADRRARLPAQPLAARRATEVRGEDL